MRHADYMAMAIDEARSALGRGDVPVGAVLVCDGEVVARGYNTREALLDPTGHAELNAVREGARRLGRWRLHGCTLYVTLEPCPMCASALVQARLDRLVYGAMDAKQGAAGTVWNLTEDPRLNHRVEVVTSVSESACAELLTQFFQAQRSRP